MIWAEAQCWAHIFEQIESPTQPLRCPLPNRWSFVQSLQDVTLLSPQATSYYYYKCCTALSPWALEQNQMYLREQEKHICIMPENLQNCCMCVLVLAESTNSVNSDFSLQFHFRKCGVTQSWTYASHCNKTNTATETSEWESYTPCHQHMVDNNTHEKLKPEVKHDSRTPQYLKSLNIAKVLAKICCQDAAKPWHVKRHPGETSWCTSKDGWWMKNISNPSISQDEGVTTDKHKALFPVA